jgi:hypothetical protein
MTDDQQVELETWARQCKLGNPNSPTTQQLYVNRNLTVRQYISQFRKSSLNAIVPETAKNFTVEEALKLGRIGEVNIRKLLIDRREKFSK